MEKYNLTNNTSGYKDISKEIEYFILEVKQIEEESRRLCNLTDDLKYNLKGLLKEAKIKVIKSKKVS